uniref:Uncharacterized protein n=1 Tax=Rhipicephalus zambeziensis TaxID=60191 RepID=A0A224YE48_9ACAR
MDSTASIMTASSQTVSTSKRAKRMRRQTKPPKMAPTRRLTRTRGVPSSSHQEHDAQRWHNGTFAEFLQTKQCNLCYNFDDFKRL